MDKYASGQASFSDYFEGSLGWFVLFCVFTFLAVALTVVSFSCVFCPKCCQNCKRDLKRSDYQK